MTGQTLLVRADASATIGTGHIMRCIALAQAWQDRGGSVVFACAGLPPALQARLSRENITLSPIHAAAGSKDDAAQLCDIASAVGARVVVVDGYLFLAEYQKSVKEAGLRLLFIDDNGHAEYYYADFVLNQNAHAHTIDYSLRSPETTLLLGTSYTLLRREFWPYIGMQREIAPVAKKILVTMGGSDPHNVSLKIVEALRGAPYEVVIIVGGSNPNLEALQNAADRAGMRIVVDVTDMPAWMQWADIAITAAGSTCWEMAFMGLPMILIVIAENQALAADILEKQCVSLNLKWHTEISRDAILKTLKIDYDARCTMRTIGQQMIDSRGGHRICQIINT